MVKLENISRKMKNKILEFLYQDELMNVFMIHFFESDKDKNGKIYIEKCGENITSIIVIKDDGNSHFTTYYTVSSNGLKLIAQLLKTLNFKDILLAGKAEEVKYILDNMDLKKELYLNNYYKLNLQNYHQLKTAPNIKLRRATKDIYDLNKIKEYLISFFEVKKESAIKRITNEDKLNEQISNGIYFLEDGNQSIGMARFYGQSSKFIDITTLYIDEQFRGKGFGKILVSLMIEIALSSNRIPILQTSKDNLAARKLYEQLGFEVVCDYTFQFILGKYQV